MSRPLVVLDDVRAWRSAPRAAYALRVSLTDRCQLACRYCRPGSVRAFSERERWLSPEDYERLASVFFARGVRKVRFTGGEPLLRADAASIVASFRRAMPHVPLALTTNGQRLASEPGLLTALRDAGLTRATLHVDSLRPERYRASMGGGDLDGVLAATLRAREVLADVKLNVVVQRDVNDDEIPDFLAWSRRNRVEVRFIELMNTGSAREYTAARFFSGREIVERARASAGAAPIGRRHEADPAALYATDAGVTFGVIASDTEPFCDACDRLRITSEGVLRGCLYQAGGVPLAAAARAAHDDEGRARLEAIVDAAIASKGSHHPARAEAIGADAHAFSMAEAGG